MSRPGGGGSTSLTLRPPALLHQMFIFDDFDVEISKGWSVKVVGDKSVL